MEGWVKLYRKMVDWEWINKPEMVSLFIYCLLKANHNGNYWQGQEIKRGQFVTSPEKLSIKLGITYQTVRTCLVRLEKTGEINKQTTNKYTIITICNYDSYQVEQQTTNEQTNKQLTNNQQTTNKQLTTNKNEKNNKNVKNEKNIIEFDFSFLNPLFKESFEKWISYKKGKKQMYKTQESLEDCYNNLLALSGNNPQKAMQIVCQSTGNNWAGLFELKVNSKQNSQDDTRNYIAGRIIEITGGN